MASAIIHIAVAKELSKYLDIKKPKDYYLGSIAPDISKQINESRIYSHFLYDTLKDSPNIDYFKQKYPHFKDTDFDLGYFVHLYTDKMWADDFLDKLVLNNSIKLIDGTIIRVDEEKILDLIYHDYTDLNIKIIDEYNLDLSLFYEDFILPDTKIDDIPIERLDVLLNKIGLIIKNSTEDKEYIFDLFDIKEFIENCVNLLRKELNLN